MIQAASRPMGKFQSLLSFMVSNLLAPSKSSRRASGRMAKSAGEGVWARLRGGRYGVAPCYVQHTARKTDEARGRRSPRASRRTTRVAGCLEHPADLQVHGGLRDARVLRDRAQGVGLGRGSGLREIRLQRELRSHVEADAESGSPRSQPSEAGRHVPRLQVEPGNAVRVADGDADVLLSCRRSDEESAAEREDANFDVP